MPKVSVIIGVFNGAERIKKAVDSILKQTYKDFEIIICDDGSIDNSIEVIEDIALKDKRIKIIKNKKNLGLAVSLNKCLEIATGEYIARMDDDDISHSSRFEKQVRFLESNPKYSIVGTSRNMYDEKGIWGKSILEGERSKLDIYLGNSFAHPSVMLKKEALLDVDGYTTGSETERTEDFDLWCKLYQKGYRGYNLNCILIDYYEAKNSYNKRKYKYRINEFNLKKKWRKKLKLPIKYTLFAYRPLIVGLIPVKFLMKYHERKFI